jgi:hypothetical protein
MKLKLGLLSVCVALAIWSCQKPAQSSDEVSLTAEEKAAGLTAEEKAAGWELLFDGATLDGWKQYGHDTITALWSVRDSAIVCDGTGLGEGSGAHGGSLRTLKEFGNFELAVDWKITPGGNSGILYHVVEKPEFATDYATGPEYQVMDDGGWTGGELTPQQKAGSNYDMFAAPDTKKVMPVGEWNNARIVYNNGHVEHWLNGEKVVEFEEGSPEYEAAYNASKWVDFPGWNKFKSGSISLQDHGAPVYYRNIKIRSL